MPVPILSTKLYIPALRPRVVHRQRLITRLNEGMQRKLILVSAAAGSGKTTLVSQWLASSPHLTAWISLEEADNDPARFLTYLFASLQRIVPTLGGELITSLQSPQSPPVETLITYLLNEVSVMPDPVVLVLDDFHVIKQGAVNEVLIYLLDRMPPNLHLVMTTREQPHFPLGRLRVQDQLIEIGGNNLRFDSTESDEFLKRVMGLDLPQEDAALLEARTEGWIAGMQLAALSVQRSPDPGSFIHSFNGSHPVVLDYLVEEVLQLQSERIQTFLLQTSILERLCGSLCEAVFDGGDNDKPLPFAFSGQQTLEWLEQANLFVVPLDNERRWYRYHHLFADLLRKRLHQSLASGKVDAKNSIAELHKRASIWYENNELELEAFHHAAAAGDTDRAAYLLEGKGMPLLFRGAVAPALHWLSSLSTEQMNAKPSLLVMHASALLMAGQMSDVEPKLLAAEQALQAAGLDCVEHDLIGHVASIRATIAVSRHEAETIIAESLLALKYLHPGNLPVRSATAWTLGYAYQLQGKRVEAGLSYMDSLSSSEKIGHHIITMMAALGLGNIQEADNQLHLAAEYYQRVLSMAGNPPLPIACEAHLGLARVNYEWNNLDTAAQHATQSVQLAKQFEHTDRVVASEVLLARVMLARSDARSAAAVLNKADVMARQQKYVKQIPDITAAYVRVLLRQGNLREATQLSQERNHPYSQARVLLAQGNPSAALTIMESALTQAEFQNFRDEELKAKVLLAVVLQEQGVKPRAVKLLAEALMMAEPAGMIRIFLDEGISIHSLLMEIIPHGNSMVYLRQLLAACEAEASRMKSSSDQNKYMAGPGTFELQIDPLSGRELEVLRLIAQGRSNREISEQLHIAMATVKGHNRIIFDKLQVKRRTEAVARARERGLL